MSACNNWQVIVSIYNSIKQAGNLSDAFGADHESYEIHFGKPMINVASMNSTTHVEEFNSIKDDMHPFQSEPTQVIANSSGLASYSPMNLARATKMML